MYIDACVCAIVNECVFVHVASFVRVIACRTAGAIMNRQKNLEWAGSDGGLVTEKRVGW